MLAGNIMRLTLTRAAFITFNFTRRAHGSRTPFVGITGNVCVRACVALSLDLATVCACVRTRRTSATEIVNRTSPPLS